MRLYTFLKGYAEAKKVIGCSNLGGGGGELGTIKTLTYGSN